MIPIKRITLAAVLIGSISQGRAAEPEASMPAFHPYSVGAEVGTTGVGGMALWRFSSHFGVRAGMDYASYSHSDSLEGVDYNAKLRLQSEPVTLDIYPWSHRSFRVSLGAAFNQNRFSGTGSSTKALDIGDNTYQPAQIGSLNLRVEQESVNPYLSLAGNFFYFDSAHHWALGGEIGAMYTGKAKVTLTTTSSVSGLAADLAKEKKQLQDKLDEVQFWPVLKLAAVFSF